MKILMGSVLCIALIAAGCGGSSGPSCADVCAKMTECDPENDAVECNDMCGQFKQVMRSTAYRALGDCYMDSSCATIIANEDICMAAAIAKVPAGAVDRFVNGLCTKMVECDGSGTLTQQACITDLQSSGSDMLEMIGIFSDSVLDCVVNCADQIDCAQLEDGMDDCFPQCGLDFL
jgi:hypothetical protein